jgi:hypothetical protein
LTAFVGIGAAGGSVDVTRLETIDTGVDAEDIDELEWASEDIVELGAAAANNTKTLLITSSQRRSIGRKGRKEKFWDGGPCPGVSRFLLVPDSAQSQ